MSMTTRIVTGRRNRKRWVRLTLLQTSEYDEGAERDNRGDDKCEMVDIIALDTNVRKPGLEKKIQDIVQRYSTYGLALKLVWYTLFGVVDWY